MTTDCTEDESAGETVQTRGEKNTNSAVRRVGTTSVLLARTKIMWGLCHNIWLTESVFTLKIN